MSSAIAVPLVSRGFLATTGESISASPMFDAAEQAAEHVLWRLGHDPDFLDSMTGSPPSATYVISLPAGDATIVVTASAAEPVDDGLQASLAVEPARIAPNTPATVTYTLTVVNDDAQPHEISRAEADPRTFSPQYVTGSTVGFTTDDPVYTAGRWRWQLLPYAVVEGFGASLSIAWQMVVDENQGTYWTNASVRVEGVGVIDAPLTASLRVADEGPIDIQSVVTPSGVSAGADTTFQYTITVSNPGAAPHTLESIKHFSPRVLSYVTGSTVGATTADPQVNHDVINDRWEHTWDVDPTTLLPGASVTLTFQMQAQLSPGTYFATSAANTSESGGGQNTSVSTGDAAPISALRAYSISVTAGSSTVDVEAQMSSDGVEVTSWTSS